MKRVAVVAVLVAAACGDRAAESPPAQDSTAQGTADTSPPAPSIDGDTIHVTFADSAGGNAGHAMVMRQDSGVAIHVQLTGLTPGEHGFHVHEAGTCEAPKFESAGAHYSPQPPSAQPRQHGTENPQGPHAGDLPNLRANAEGAVDTLFTTTRLSWGDGAAPLIKRGGAALVVHATADDYRTDPSGNSGNRVLCGVLMR